MPRTKQEPGSRQSSGRYAYLLPGLSDRGYENTLMVWMSLSWLWNQCWLPSCFLLLFFFQDSSLIKIKIWSRNLGPRELFISLHSYKGILLFPAFLLKDTECKSLSRMGLFETLRTSLQAPLSMGFSRPEYWVEFSRPEYWVEFSRPEYWSGQPLPSPGIFLTQELKSPALQADSLPAVILNRFLSTEGCTNQLHLPREAPRGEIIWMLEEAILLCNYPKESVMVTRYSLCYPHSELLALWLRYWEFAVIF